MGIFDLLNAKHESINSKQGGGRFVMGLPEIPEIELDEWGVEN